MLRGLNAADYTDAEVGMIFWAMGLYLGRAVTQNPKGDLLGHVYDHGRRYGDIDVRGYETSAHLPFHTDSGDIVGLLCLKQARRGPVRVKVDVRDREATLRFTEHPYANDPRYRLATPAIVRAVMSMCVGQSASAKITEYDETTQVCEVSW